MGKKMKFEKEKTFGIKARLGRWKKNKENWNTPIEKKEILPNYFNKTLWSKLPPEKIKEYKAKLINLGWVYSSNSIATYWRAPDKKIHWL